MMHSGPFKRSLNKSDCHGLSCLLARKLRVRHEAGFAAKFAWDFWIFEESERSDTARWKAPLQGEPTFCDSQRLCFAAMPVNCKPEICSNTLSGHK